MPKLVTSPEFVNKEPIGRLCWVIRGAAGDDFDEEPADIYLFDHVGLDTRAADFVKELAGIKTARITLHINSRGGFIDDGLAMYNALRQHPATVEARVESVAASAASFVAMAADKVLIARTARMMIHDAQMFAIGPAAFFRLVADRLEEESQNIAAIYAERSSTPASLWRARMLANDGMGTSYRGDEAVEAELADAILEHPPRQSALEPLRAAAIAHAEELSSDRMIPTHGGRRKETDSWDGDEAKARLRRWASSDGSGDKDTINWGKYGNAFATSTGEGDDFGDFHYPHHDVDDDGLFLDSSGVDAAWQRARQQDDSDAQGHVQPHRKQFGKPDDDLDGPSTDGKRNVQVIYRKPLPDPIDPATIRKE